jgi:hypothetical protein
MLAEGKITAAEAERLISVLDEVEGVERELEGVADAADRAAAPTPAAEAPADDAAGGWSGIGRWVEVSMLAGDLDVRLDESIVTPEVRSGDGSAPVEVVSEGEGFRISQFGTTKGDLLNRLVEGLKRSDLDIRLPPGYNLHLDMKAGDVSIRDIPYLKGKVLAGDVDARGLLGVDLKMQAGDLDLQLRPTDGRHRVHVSAGDVTVRLQPGSSAQVRGRVSIGEVSTSGMQPAERSGLGASVNAAVGGGAADLDLRLSTGQLTLKVHDE